MKSCVSARFKYADHLNAHWTLADEQRPPQIEDIYWGEPGASSIQYVTDLHPGKAATDIVVLGHALDFGQNGFRGIVHA